MGPPATLYSVYCEGSDQPLSFLLRHVLRVERQHVHVAKSVEELLASSAQVLVVGGDGADSRVPAMGPAEVLALRGRRLFGFGPLGAAVCIAIGMHTFEIAHFGLDLEWKDHEGRRHPILRADAAADGVTDKHPVTGLHLPTTSVLSSEVFGLVRPTRAVHHALVVREANTLWTGVPYPERLWSGIFANKMSQLFHELVTSDLAPSSWPSWPIQREGSYSCAIGPYNSPPYDDDKFLEFRRPGSFRIVVRLRGRPRDVSMYLLSDYLGKFVVGARPRRQEIVELEFTLEERDISENLAGLWRFVIRNFDEDRATRCEVTVSAGD